MVRFEAPTGEEIEWPTVELLRDRLLFGDADYWQGAPGDARIVFDEPGHRAELLLELVPEAGVLVRYTDSDVELFLGDDTPEGEDPLAHVSTTQTGDVWITARDTFVRRATAVRAVEEFLKSGRREMSLNWRPSITVYYPPE